MSRLTRFDSRSPLSMLTAAQLLELAGEVRALALTASTPDVARSLNALVVRYVRLAGEREFEDGRSARH